MARASALAENNALAGIFAAAQPTPSTTNTWVSLHTADPGTTGASEYAGVTRIQYSVGSPSAGSITNTATATFTTSGVSAVSHIGTWDALTTGNYRIGAPLASSVTAVTITFAVGSQTFTAT
ncbi:MAG: hypothetical protein JO222_00860 [Frankiales bacterium]|nr:hypothetical protein [Frankiales bacterium]